MIDEEIRSIVRQSIATRQPTPRRQPATPPAQHVVGMVALSMLLAAVVIFLSDVYAEARMSDYLEFHQMMADQSS